MSGKKLPGKPKPSKVLTHMVATFETCLSAYFLSCWFKISLLRSLR